MRGIRLGNPLQSIAFTAVVLLLVLLTSTNAKPAGDAVTEASSPLSFGHFEEFIARWLVRLSAGVALIVLSCKAVEWAIEEVDRSITAVAKSASLLGTHLTSVNSDEGKKAADVSGKPTDDTS